MKYLEILEEVQKRDDAIMSLMATSAMKLDTIMSLTIGDLLKSYEYAYPHVHWGHIPSIEEIAFYTQKEDMVSIFEVEDMFGDIYYTCNSPDSTRAIMDYLMVRIMKKGQLDSYEKLFPDIEIEEEEW